MSAAMQAVRDERNKAQEAIQLFKSLLTGKRLSRNSPTFDASKQFITSLKGQLQPVDREEIVNAFQDCFQLSDSELLAITSGIVVAPSLLHGASGSNSKLTALQLEQELLEILPKGGFLEQYANYTARSEAPLAYHIFCALTAVGCMVARKCYFNMGYYHLYPPLGVFLLGPSGLRKTSAGNIAVRLVQKIELSKVYPEKFTPEAVTLSIAEYSQGLLYGPEMSATLGKQKYLEGLIPLLTRLQDCPDSLISDTISRGKVLLKNIAVSLLMCSTPDWFVSNTPADTFGGGFIARNLMIMQLDTPREEDIPDPPFDGLKADLLLRLTQLAHEMRGEMTMSRAARAFHKEWYHNHKERTKHPEHPLLGTYYQRKPDHMKRIAMCLQLAEHYTLDIHLSSLEKAIQLLDWSEQFIPPMLNSMFRTSGGEQHDYVMSVVRNNKGLIRHSDLVRKVQHKMSATQLKQIVASLKEAEYLTEIQTTLQHIYVLREVRRS